MAHRLLDATELQVALSAETWPKGFHDVALPLICVPIPDCVTVRLGLVDESVLGTLKDQRFDYAPVALDAGTPNWGIVDRAVLEAHQGAGTPLSLHDLLDPGVALFRIETCYIGLPGLFEALERSPALILHAGNGGPVPAADYDGEIFGLVTISDLNHREVRRACYELISEVEVRLAELVRCELPDPWEWIGLMNSDEDRARVVGYWTLLTKNNIESDPVAMLSLMQLLGIAGKSPGIRSRLRQKSRRATEDQFHGLAEFRNRVMHPVRPLVSRSTDVAKWCGVIRELAALLERGWPAARSAT